MLSTIEETMKTLDFNAVRTMVMEGDEGAKSKE